MIPDQYCSDNILATILRKRKSKLERPLDSIQENKKKSIQIYLKKIYYSALTVKSMNQFIIPQDQYSRDNILATIARTTGIPISQTIM